MPWYNSSQKEHKGRITDDLERRGNPTEQTLCQDERWLLQTRCAFCAETQSHSVVHGALQVGLELVAILLSQPLEC